MQDDIAAVSKERTGHKTMPTKKKAVTTKKNTSDYVTLCIVNTMYKLSITLNKVVEYFCGRILNIEYRILQVIYKIWLSNFCHCFSYP